MSNTFGDTQPRPQGLLLSQNGGRCNTPRTVEYFVTWHMMKWLYRRLFPAYGGPVCFLQSETVVQTKRRHFAVFTWRNSNEFLEPLRQPWPGVSPSAILNEKVLGTRLGDTWPATLVVFFQVTERGWKRLSWIINFLLHVSVWSIALCLYFDLSCRLVKIQHNS